jgi:hypothetical protein
MWFAGTAVWYCAAEEIDRHRYESPAEVTRDL